MLSFFRKDMQNEDESIEDYLTVWRKYNNNLTCKTEDYKTTNDLAKKLLAIDNRIVKNDNFLEIYKKIIFKEIKTLGGLALKISIYEPDFGKRLYMYWHESDKEKNFVGKYILDDWDVNLEEWKDGKQEKIDKYNRWKGQNKEKYERIINEISDFIFKPIKSSDETNI